MPPPTALPRPPALSVAASVTTLLGLALTGFGAWLAYENVVADASNTRVAQGSAAYFLVLGPLVLVVAWGLWTQRRWSFGAAVFVQLVAVLVTATMVQGGFWLGAALLGAAAVVGGVAVLRPETRAALGRD